VAEEQGSKTYFPISSLVDVVKARRCGLELALEMGFPRAEATKVAVVISELGRNIERYAKNGSITVITNPNDRYIMIIAQDWGPGIVDVAQVLAGGYSTSGGLGLGISGSSRLVDKFDIQSVVGAGTTIKALKWLR
jgi:serine/threonine-protein kinase RsbT